MPVTHGMSGTRLAGALAACLIAWPILWVLDPFGLLQPYLLVEQFAIAELGFCLAWAALAYGPAAPVRRPLLAAAMLILCGWLFIRFPALTLSLYGEGLEGFILSCLMMITCFIAGWFLAGKGLTGLIAVFLAYGLVAMNFPNALSSLGGSAKTFFTYMTFGSDAIIGQTLLVVTLTVSTFVLFGRAFLLAGGAGMINDLALWLGGHNAGAPVKTAVVASGLFGTISGNATSNVLTVGSVTIPLMMRYGVRPATAGGIEAVASTGGQLMPPVMGTAAFLMAEFTGIPYAEIALAALLPALLFYFVLLLEAHRIGKESVMPQAAAPESIGRAAALASLGLFAAILASICALLFWFAYAPEWAAVIGTLLCGAIALLRRRGERRAEMLHRELTEVAAILVPLVVTAAIVGVMLAVINATGLGVTLALMLEEIGGKSLFLSLLVAAVASYLLGLTLSTAAVYIISATLVAPGLVALGIPVLAAHLFVLYMAMLSMISPPVAFACLATCGLTGAGFSATCREAMRFTVIIFWIPFIFVYDPALLLIGSPWQILTALIAALAAALSACAAFAGLRAKNLLQAVGFAVLAVVLVMPAAPDVIRLILAVMIIAWFGRGLVLARQ